MRKNYFNDEETGVLKVNFSLKLQLPKKENYVNRIIELCLKILRH